MAFENFETEINISQNQTKTMKVHFDPFGPNEDGKLITKEFAQEIVQTNKWPLLGMDKNAAITFGKRALTLLLSQKGCEGIRCYFASYKNENNRMVETIVLVGINSSDDDLRAEHENVKKHKSIILDTKNEKEDVVETIIIEVGGGNPLNEFI